MAESRTGATSAEQIDTTAAREGGFSLRTTVFGADELRRAQTRIAHEIDGLCPRRDGSSEFEFFRRTSAALCAAILQRNERASAVLQQYLA